MNHTHKHFGFGYGATVAGIAVAVMLMGLTPAAEAQPAGFAPVPVSLPSSTLTSNQTVTAAAHIPIDVPPGCIAYLQPSMSAAGSSTPTNVTFSFSETLDGIVWTPATTYPLTATTGLNSTNPVTPIIVLGTNLPCKMISLDQISTTQTNVVTLTGAKILFIPTTTSYVVLPGAANGGIIR